MYFNWYDEATGEVRYVDPDGTRPITPFVSSVDNGWLACALMVVRNAEPGARALADSLLNKMNFAYYYNPAARPGGLMRGGFFETPPPDEETDKGNHAGTGPDVYYRKFHYDTCNTEARIAGYIGFALGQVPHTQYFATYRTFPDTLRLVVGGAAPQGCAPDVSRPRRLRRHLHLPRHAARAVLGR